MHITRVAVSAATNLTSAGAIPPASLSAATNIWPVWLTALLARSAERRQLLALEERDLRDIGLTPSEVRVLAQKPLWRR